MQEILERFFTSKSLDKFDCDTIFRSMFQGDLSEIQIAACLAAWRMKDEGHQELISGARAMRAAATQVTIPETARPLTDNCGTGGDGSQSFNISTAAAIITAACGVSVAKHGNRSASSKCGSADLLFAAGFPASLSADATGKLLEQTGFTFFFAPNFHPVMKHVMPVRKELGVRTIFNLLGPLANPIAPEYQLIGVGVAHAMEPMAKALHGLGIKRALVLHSQDGMDEISPAAPTDALHVSEDGVKPMEINPADFGIQHKGEALRGGDASVNLGILQRLLDGEVGAIADTVCLNAGAVLWVCGHCQDHADGFKTAQKTLSSGKAKTFFDNWITTAKGVAGGASS